MIKKVQKKTFWIIHQQRNSKKCTNNAESPMALQHRSPIKCISKLTKHRKHEGNIRKSRNRAPCIDSNLNVTWSPRGIPLLDSCYPPFLCWVSASPWPCWPWGRRTRSNREDALTLIQMHLSWLLLHFKLCGCPTSRVTSVVITTNGARSIKQEWRVPSHKCAFCLVQLSVRGVFRFFGLEREL